MDDLKAWYRERLGERIAALEGARDRLDEADAVSTVRRLAHSLRGSGKTYGFPAITDAAALVEDASAADLLGRLTNLLETLRRTRDEPSGPTIRILVVEDDLDIHLVLRTALEGPQREIRFAGSVAEAETALSEGGVSLVLLDLNLEGSDGRDLLARMRGRPDVADIPVLVVTAARGLSRSECLALGADGFVEKPFDPQGLADEVAAHLRRLSVRAEALVDPETGLSARARTVQALAEAMHEAKTLVAVALVEPAAPASGDAMRRLADAVRAAVEEPRLLGRWDDHRLLVAAPGRSAGALAAALKAARSSAGAFSAGVGEAVAPEDEARAVEDAERSLRLVDFAGGDRIVVAGEEAAAAGLPPAAQSSDRPRILVVDDDTLVLHFTTNVLGRAGYEVRLAETGAAAIVDALTNPPDLVLLDVQLPGMDGFEVCRRLRPTEKSTGRPIRILLFSGLATADDIARGENAGADGYVVKPVDAETLIRRVREALGR